MPVELCGVECVTPSPVLEVAVAPLIHRCYRAAGHDAGHKCVCTFEWCDEPTKGGDT